MDVSEDKLKVLVIFDPNEKNDWVTLFANMKLLDGSRIRVLQASWSDCKTAHYPNSGCFLTISPIRDTKGVTKPNQSVTLKPDFVVCASRPRGVTPSADCTATFYGLRVANIPSINSLTAVALDTERANMVAELNQVANRLGRENFPLIPITYFGTPALMGVWEGTYPAVAKVGNAHSGLGKAKLEQVSNITDLSKIVASTQDYCTVEPFIQPAFIVRIQKFGDNYLAYKRPVTSGWMTIPGQHPNTTEIELNDTFKLWVDECSKCFYGLDMLSVDAICDEKGKYQIIELNTTLEIPQQFWPQTAQRFVDFTLAKMDEALCQQDIPQEIKQKKETTADWRSRQLILKRKDELIARLSTSFFQKIVDWLKSEKSRLIVLALSLFFSGIVTTLVFPKGTLHTANFAKS